MLRYNSFRPVTCQCVLIEQVDTDTGIESVVDTVTIRGTVHVTQRCSFHQGLSAADLYDVIVANPMGEQKRFSKIWELLESGEINAGPRGNVNWEIQWNGTGAARSMTITLLGLSLSPQKQARLQQLLDAAYGVGSITVLYAPLPEA